MVILPVEYNWLQSYLDNDLLWLEESLNWEEVFTLILSDLTVYSFLTTPFFLNSHFFLDSMVKFSFLDLLFLLESDPVLYPRELYDLFLWDQVTTLSTKFLPAQFLFYTDYQDFVVVLLYYSPELISVFGDFVDFFWMNQVFKAVPAAVFDLFSDSALTALTQFLEYVTAFFLFAWLVVIFIHTMNFFGVKTPVEAYLIRLAHYLYSISRESRTQFESFLQTFFFIFLYWTMMVFTFDDDREELIEIFDVNMFYFFCFLIAFLVFRYSLHYFAFLEASVVEGRGVAFITKQFFRDFINTFALLLRFFILLFRLNVYDTLDDFYDSYYIFLGDFDDDEYVTELFFSAYPLMFYDLDVNDDRLYSLEDENDFFADLFYIYYLCWAKFFTFYLFILEEILRLALGFYICYLIIFEVHSVNCTYVEDLYIVTQRNESHLQPLSRYTESFRL